MSQAVGKFVLTRPKFQFECIHVQTQYKSILFKDILIEWKIKIFKKNCKAFSIYYNLLNSISQRSCMKN
jgi:hypothetical protein